MDVEEVALEEATAEDVMEEMFLTLMLRNPSVFSGPLNKTILLIVSVDTFVISLLVNWMKKSLIELSITSSLRLTFPNLPPMNMKLPIRSVKSWKVSKNVKPFTIALFPVNSLINYFRCPIVLYIKLNWCVDIISKLKSLKNSTLKHVKCVFFFIFIIGIDYAYFKWNKINNCQLKVSCN